ncbi:MAG: cobalamin-dependent protein, partial [Geobacteraceae bacterium]
METEKKTRVLIAKPGLDGHERGARVIAYGLRDQGYEVIYTGLRQKPEDIVKAAIQEDVKVLGLSILSGSHLTMTKKVMDKLAAENAKDILV